MRLLFRLLVYGVPAAEELHIGQSITEPALTAPFLVPTLPVVNLAYMTQLDTYGTVLLVLHVICVGKQL
jgi:hypothetical protein